MKKLLLLILSTIALTVFAQNPVLYPEDRCNRVFYSGISSAITYSASYSLFNSSKVKKNHLYPLVTSLCVNLALGGLSYLVDNTNKINKRQNITAWFGGSLVTITILRIGLN